ncbi:MAG: hypothetical protein ACRD0U_07680 [Acidimicrobiales bacterium]
MERGRAGEEYEWSDPGRSDESGGQLMTGLVGDGARCEPRGGHKCGGNRRGVERFVDQARRTCDADAEQAPDKHNRNHRYGERRDRAE